MILRQILQKTLPALPLLVGAFFIHSALGAGYVVPSASMEPTLEIGDEIIAVVPSYGWGTANLPFAAQIPALPHLRIFTHLPHRGDVVVFRAPANLNETWVKRVIGLPGDRVALSNGHVFLNGKALPWHDKGPDQAELTPGIFTPARRYEETLPDGTHHDILKLTTAGTLDTVSTFTVPAGQLFVMGDNRDDSADSRVPAKDGGVGLLPVWNLQGKAVTVLFSWRNLKRLLLSV
ncbi:signal peptidase I [Gluconobacter thailandicus]|uniref:Signal peptidase I n=1 Tax=Gluconobacter thailandicus TaxID=257438 RepID=A0AAP9ERK5_GLUTH|nr:signal peptidase I [Gluconobacter thailandicus]QEH95655.1 signal peptidase I [Gluconobacter thailandicus]